MVVFNLVPKAKDYVNEPSSMPVANDSLLCAKHTKSGKGQVMWNKKQALLSLFLTWCRKPDLNRHEVSLEGF